MLKSSCAMTLSKKYKLISTGAVFKRFGKLFECPKTGVKFYKPDTLKATHDYKNTGVPDSLDLVDIS